MTAATAMLRQPYLVIMAVVAWLALALQVFLVVKLVIAEGRSALVGIVNTFSYFTVLTNLLVAIVSTVSALQGNTSSFLTRPSTMSAVAVYIFIVGIIYSLLLRSMWDPTGLQALADSALHDITPIMYTLYWIFFVPKGTLQWSQSLGWLIFPLLYVAYYLVRGALTGIYPYHFADVTLLGYPKALTNTALFLIGFLILSLVAVAIDRFVGRSVTL